MIKLIFNCLVLCSLLAIVACNNPADIDANIIDIDIIDVQTRDDFDLSSYTTTEDSIITFQQVSSFVLLNRYPFGIYEDPIFGQSTASIPAQFLLLDAAPDFINAIVDSVILEIPFSDDQPFYGDTTEMLGIEVLQISETLDFNTEYFTNHVTELEGAPIGTFEGMPNFRDSVEVYRWEADSLTIDTFPPLIRVTLDNAFGQSILNSPEGVLNTNADFLEEFKGLFIRPTNPNRGLVAFDVQDITSALQTGIPGVTVQIFYTQNGIRDQYEIAIEQNLSVKFEEFSTDISGSTVEMFLEDELLGDSLVFVQGLNGTNAVVRLNDVEDLNGTIINGAFLEVFAQVQPGEEDLYPVNEQLVLREPQSDGTLLFTRDFELALAVGSISAAGGEPEDMGNGIFRYTFNIGAQLQDIIEGVTSNEVVIRANAKVSTMNRTVIFGPGHSTYPMKLNVTFTNL